MVCPKCHMEQEDQNLLCDYCRHLFVARESPAHGVAAETTASFTARAVKSPIVYLRERMFTPQLVGNPIALGGRAVLLLILSFWGWRLASATVESNAAGESFWHLVNLPFHEAGHVFFTPFGDFVRVLGGTLGQFIMPMVCCLVLLLKTRDPFGAGAALWWFGENFLDIAPYIADAGTGELPLLGGNTGESTPYGFHDWEYLLTETGKLGRDQDIARTSQAMGATIILIAVAWMATMLWQSYRLWRAGVRTEVVPSKAA